MKTTTLSRIIAGCMLAPFTVHAQSAPRQPRGERPSFQTMWEKYDANGDGFLSTEEFQSMPRIARLPEDKQMQLFKRLDKNADGKVSMAELREIRQNKGGERPALGMRRLMELDTNGSGGVSLEEFRAGEMFANLPPERVESLFRRLDSNGDGEITPADRPELPPMLRQGQAPRGERERGERQVAHRRLFNHLDIDKSSSLDFEQFRKARGIASLDEDAQEKLFLRLDLDGNRQLSFEEFSKAPLAELAPPPRRGDDGRRRGRSLPGDSTPRD